MTAAEFIQKWSDSELRERQGAQEHFIDLCRLIGEPTPAEDDRKGDHYCFERGAEKVGGGDGWADVWRGGCFGWEYKGKHKNLDAALRQLQAYALDLENPPFLVVSDMDRIIVHTNWTNTVSKVLSFTLDDLREPAKLDTLRQIFQGSERLRPVVSPQDITAKAAARFGELGRRLQERGHEPRAVAHFLNRLVFCMFAEDARLLPAGLFTRVVRATEGRPDHATSQLGDLFAKMKGGGFFGADVIRWFNGGLFDDAGVLPLIAADLKLVAGTAEEHDWSEIDPAIFGNLFEQALKATRERPALGAHYTDREKILKIVEPVIVRPLMAEWENARAEIAAAMDAAKAAEAERRAVEARGAEALRKGAEEFKAGEARRRKERGSAIRARTEAEAKARAILESFILRLANFRVLDPACGSGNFLYVALHALKDVELRAIVDSDRLGVPNVPNPRVGLDTVRGIEIEEYAAELARVTLWIGDLQWMRRNGYTNWQEPILSSLDQIERRDALLNPDGSEAEWPKADVIIGNPPFLGGKRMRSGLGAAYVNRLWSTYEKGVPHFSDFVCYWFAKAWQHMDRGLAEGGGLVATNSIRGGASRVVLDRIAKEGRIFCAWSDEPWTVEGAAVRVSMVCFDHANAPEQSATLDGAIVARINPDLTSFAYNITQSIRLAQNAGACFEGGQKFGAFDIAGDLARPWLESPINPNGRSNSDVLRPYLNAADVVRRSSDTWIIDFDSCETESDAAAYELPFELIKKQVQPERDRRPDARNKRYWWRHHRSRPEMRKALAVLKRYIATPVVAKHRIFVWLDLAIWPSNLLDATISIPRWDDMSTMSRRFLPQMPAPSVSSTSGAGSVGATGLARGPSCWVGSGIQPDNSASA